MCIYLSCQSSPSKGQAGELPYLPNRRHKVMLAHGEDLNVLHNDHLVVILMKYSPIHNVPQILFVPLCEEHHGLRIPLWCLEETFTVWILADAFKDCTDGARELVEAGFGFFGSGFEACAGAGA